ncbi:MAG: S-methyl-5-thioribose kinase [Bacteroidota bacterium]
MKRKRKSMGSYTELTDRTSIEYLKNHTNFFSPEDKVVSTEIGDGNVNWVFRINTSDNSTSVIFKQALPYLRILGDGWPLTIDRSRIEAETTKTFGRICPDCVPRVLHDDPEMAVAVFEDLGYLELMRTELMQMRCFPKFPEQMGFFLARTFLHTSHLVMDAGSKKEAVKKYVNPELCKLVEDLVFTDPFFDAPGNNVNPELRAEAESIWSQPQLFLEASCLKEIYMNKAQSLIHGDLHTGSIFINENEIRVFDAEFAFYGPPSYDMGCVLGNLLLNYASWEAHPDRNQQEIKEYRDYLMKSFVETYDSFKTHFMEIWHSDVREEFTRVKGFAEQCLKDHLRESIGFAGCECIRRTLGLAHTPDTSSLENDKLRARAQKYALGIGQKLLLSWNDIESIDQAADMI